jgi:predicted Zn finger-like uncharacterized protein
MSLATRCTNCGTVFRVVQDQLKMSEGWVRCGRCDEAFNALEELFDLERDSGAMGLDIAADAAASDRAHAPTEPLPLAELPGARTAPTAPKPADFGSRSRSARRAPAPAPSAESAPASMLDWREEPRWDLPPADALAERPQTRRAARDDDSAPESETPPTDAPALAAQPDFLRRAQRAAAWRRPGVRALLAAGCVLLGLALALQWVLHQRDVLAAYRPHWAPALKTLCSHVGCEVQTLRDIGAIVVDSSGLEATDSASRFRFQTVLRNQAPVAIATPALDLTLTDSGGQVVARKTLRAQDFGAAVPRTIAPGSELPLGATLDVGGLRVVGYTVLAYYP